MSTLISGEKCKKCGWEWKPQIGNENPVKCPHCGSPYWNREPKKKEETENN
jgi:predicted Zn-ribbon and HTH transcriptional regulator